MEQAGRNPALPRRFALTRYFAFASLVCTLALAALLGWSYQFLALRDLTHLGEDRNLALTHALSNSLWPKFAPLVGASGAASADELQSLAAGNDLYSLVVRQLIGTEVVKVKVYSLSGRTVFSSEPRQTGEDKNDNPAFRAAIAGEVTSGLTHRDSFDAFEGTRNDLDVISTYLPIRDEAGKIVAVFEIYSDVTDLTSHLDRTRSMVIATVAGLLALLYALLYLLVARAQGIIDRQEALSCSSRSMNSTIACANAPPRSMPATANY